MPNHFNQTPNWQPLSQLPLIAQMIDGELAGTLEQYQTLLEARYRPHILDDYTVGRVIKLYEEQMEFLNLYAEQISRWKAENLNAVQEKEISRLEEQLKKLCSANAEILALANQLKEGTIEKVLAKSNLEIGIDAFLGKIKF